MKLLRLALLSLICISVATPTLAVDRDAKMVDMLAIVYREYDQMETIGVLVQGEQRLTYGSSWSIIADVGWNIASTGATTDPELWLFKLGLKKYITESAAVSAYGMSESIESGSDFRVGSGHIELDYRFLPAEAEVAPFMALSLGYASGKSTPWTSPSANFSAYVASLSLGCDVILNPDAVMSFEVRLNESAEASGGPYSHYADGMTGLLGFKYYWMD